MRTRVPTSEVEPWWRRRGRGASAVPGGAPRPSSPRSWRRKRRLLLNAAVVLVVGLAVLRAAARGSTPIVLAVVALVATGVWMLVDRRLDRRRARARDDGGRR
ncbi:hypothetical protein [Cellulomonas fimi]|uniref:Uncharacterized protein n=1 Tax=Cellulomonas fimi (strain ATCC 484 / DSM 20113 / JCM 1341 / CCUG 24087 / LMG 16345 / NBRC 15513 / NCIMB 8980 / NCTC 7547 / NRS-133) TaxID=590998 RepID=F4H5B2_CELFA|nr:hypothetical protein [Cellulomonas fimi]AEE47835.1 hypothetical protein Celf_3729 [Cellulomonas fimi ATCC 484]NNH06027.1 hypothetical protein [Cellulomonas fimi]